MGIVIKVNGKDKLVDPKTASKEELWQLADQCEVLPVGFGLGCRITGVFPRTQVDGFGNHQFGVIQAHDNRRESHSPAME